MIKSVIETLRKYKLSYQVFNFFKKSKLVYNVPLYKKYNLKKRYFSSISSVDFNGLESPLNIYDAKDSRIELPDNLAFRSLEEKIKPQLLPWTKDGYAILNNFFSEEKIDDINKELEDLRINGDIKFKNEKKVMFAIHKSKVLNDFGNDVELNKILTILLGKKVKLFQSINFLKGSQQKAHSDSLHMTTFPYGNLIAVWIALEDINEDCGPIEYYPESHKLPYVLNQEYKNIGSRYKLGAKSYGDYEEHIEDLLVKGNLEKKTFVAKKGEILIWHANLLHGGAKVINTKSTRKSMVLHYFANDAICFHEIAQRPALI